MEITKTLHLMMLSFACIFIFTGTRIGKLFYIRGKSRQFDTAQSIAVIVLWICYNIYYFSPERFSWSVSLPLQICDITALVAAIAVYSPRRPLRAIMYYWAFIFTIQAFIFPVGDQDPGALRFWFFWILHITIMNCAVYDLTVRKYRPHFKDLLTSIVCMAAYMVLMLPVDYYFGWNYGYIGNALPDMDTPLNAFGPWPIRVLWLFLVAVFIQFLITLPWLRRFKLR